MKLSLGRDLERAGREVGFSEGQPTHCGDDATTVEILQAQKNWLQIIGKVPVREVPVNALCSFMDRRTTGTRVLVGKNLGTIQF